MLAGRGRSQSRTRGVFSLLLIWTYTPLKICARCIDQVYGRPAYIAHIHVHLHLNTKVKQYPKHSVIQGQFPPGKT